MANKQSKQALKRRTEKKHRRVQAKRALARRAGSHRLPAALTAAAPFSAGLPKLSAQIWDYAEPLTSAAVDVEGQMRAVDIAIICWNVAFLPEKQRKESIRPALREIAGGDEALETELHDMFEMMYARKRALFADDSRFVINYSVTDTPGGLRLLVASSPLPPEKAVEFRA